MVGCGGGGLDNDVKTDTTIKLSEEGENIDIEKAKESIRSQLVGTERAEFFVAPDQKDIFVLLQTHDLIALYDYDTTVYPPIQRNMITSTWEDHIIDVVVLPDGKLLYQQETPVSLTIVHVYDYILTKDICRYHIWFDGSIKLQVSKDLKQFTVSDITVDISYLYREVPYMDQMVYENRDMGVVVDKVNKLVWQNDASVVEKTYTLEEAKAYCREKKPQNSWRIPTMDDINKLLMNREEILPYFIFYRNDDSIFNSYWVADNFNKNEYNIYHLSRSDVSPYTQIDISIGEEAQKLYIRCVADLNENILEKIQ